MITVLSTSVFDSWLAKLKDSRGKARIIHRIRALERGNFGDSRTVGPGIMVKAKSIELAPFDASDYLDNEEVIAEYLAAALEDEDPNAFLVAVRDVAKARGMSDVAATSGLGRESLYKALRPGAQPRFETVRCVLAALGVRIELSPVGRKKRFS